MSIVEQRLAMAIGVPLVQALAPTDEYGVDGLLGMNFLENYNFTVRPRDRQIHLEPVESGEAAPAG